MSEAIHQRILLKLSGGILIGAEPFGIDPQVVERLAAEIAEVTRLGVEVAIVIGGGNLFRGAALEKRGLDRITSDQMGMLSTMINALSLHSACINAGVPSQVLSAIAAGGVIDLYRRHQAIALLEMGKVVILSGGTGNPLFTTDSAASLRAIEISADILLKATDVDGIYAEDPDINPQAQLYDQLTFKEVLRDELAVMDLAAFCQCRDHQLPIRVFNINRPGALKRIICGEPLGTLVT